MIQYWIIKWEHNLKMNTGPQNVVAAVMLWTEAPVSSNHCFPERKPMWVKHETKKTTDASLWICVKEGGKKSREHEKGTEAVTQF